MLAPLLAALATARVGAAEVEAYGFVRVDAILDDSPTDHVQRPFVVLPESSGAERAAAFSLHPRLTRLGLRAGGPRIAARVEIDFQNGGGESRQFLRIRHAYFEAKAAGFSVLVGQTWDVIAPLVPAANHDTLMWNAGNAGDRHPQIRAGWERAWFRAEVAAYMPGAVESGGSLGAREVDVDGDGQPDGEIPEAPGGQARVGVATRLGRAGIGGHAARTEIAGETLLGVSGQIDFEVAPLPWLAVRGEAFAGQDLADVRGGAGQGVAVDAGRVDEVRSAGGWAEVVVKPLDPWTVAPGLSIDDPKDEDLAAGGRSRNWTAYLANQLDLGEGVTLGADYVRWTTEYLGRSTGTDNRFNVWVSYAP